MQALRWQQQQLLEQPSIQRRKTAPNEGSIKMQDCILLTSVPLWVHPTNFSSQTLQKLSNNSLSHCQELIISPLRYIPPWAISSRSCKWLFSRQMTHESSGPPNKAFVRQKSCTCPFIPGHICASFPRCHPKINRAVPIKQIQVSHPCTVLPITVLREKCFSMLLLFFFFFPTKTDHSLILSRILFSV